MTAARRFFPVILVLLAAVNLRASGDIGIYGIIERVVFEPNERAPERIQVWGAFAYADKGAAGSVSPVKRGYLYFTVSPAVITVNGTVLYPKPGTSKVVPPAVLAEWNDLKTVAGTGQAIAFGLWDYTGRFTTLDPNASSSNVPHIYEKVPGGPRVTDMRVRSETEPPASPAVYQTNVGIVKLSDQGAHADLVKELRSALKR